MKQLELYRVPAYQLWLGATATNTPGRRLAGDDRVAPHIGSGLGRVLYLAERVVNDGECLKEEKVEGSHEWREKPVTNERAVMGRGCDVIKVTSVNGAGAVLPCERLWVSETDSESETQIECLPGLRGLYPPSSTVDSGVKHHLPLTPSPCTPSPHTPSPHITITDGLTHIPTCSVSPPSPAHPETSMNESQSEATLVISSEEEEEDEEKEVINGQGERSMATVEYDSGLNTTNSSVFNAGRRTVELNSDEGSVCWEEGGRLGSLVRGEEGSDEGIGMEEEVEPGEGAEPGEGGRVIVVIGSSEDEAERNQDRLTSGMALGPVIRCCGMELSQGDLCTLAPNECLNDQV